MSNAITRYDTARRALAEAVRVDEAKSIRDKAMAMAVYAKQAKDVELLQHATDIRLRAERKAGALLREMVERGERADKKQNLKHSKLHGVTSITPKLSDLDISKVQSHRWQKLAELDESDFEERLAHAVVKVVKAADGSPRPRINKKQARIARSAKVFGSASALAMRLRALVLEFMRQVPPAEWEGLLAAARDELDDLERVQREGMQRNGHLPAGQPA